MLSMPIKWSGTSISSDLWILALSGKHSPLLKRWCYFTWTDPIATTEPSPLGHLHPICTRYFLWVTQRYGQLKVPDIIKVQELVKKKFQLCKTSTMISVSSVTVLMLWSYELQKILTQSGICKLKLLWSIWRIPCSNAVTVPKTGKVNLKIRRTQEISGNQPPKAFCYYHSFDRPNNSHTTKDCRDMK
jgi:hypothetical protein